MHWVFSPDSGWEVGEETEFGSGFIGQGNLDDVGRSAVLMGLFFLKSHLKMGIGIRLVTVNPSF